MATVQLLSELIDWLALQVTTVKSHYTLSEAIQIIAELEQLRHGQLPLEDTKFVSAVDFSATIAKLRPMTDKLPLALFLMGQQHQVKQS